MEEGEERKLLTLKGFEKWVEVGAGSTWKVLGGAAFAEHASEIYISKNTCIHVPQPNPTGSERKNLHML